MAHRNGSPDTLEKHQYEVCNAFARAAVAMRDAASTAESFSNWFSRVNNLQGVPIPPMFNGPYNFMQNGGPQQQPYQGSETEPTGKKRKVTGDQEGKRKRPVKDKKEKDLNAPKRPPSAYLLFQNEVRGSVKGEHPDMPYNQILAEISKLWHALSPEEKAPYVQATADSKVLYEKAKADYDAHSPTDTTAAKEPTAKETPAKETMAKETTSKGKTPAVPAAGKVAAKTATTSDDDDDGEGSGSSSSSTSSTSDDDDDEKAEEEEKAPEPVPEPPRKKSKKEAVKAPAPPPSKAEKKKKPEEGKKKKKADTT